MSKRAVAFPLPRRVVGVPARCRNADTVLVLDEVPLLVPEVSGDDAPAAFVATLHGALAGKAADRDRYHGGGYWRALDYGDRPEGLPPEDLVPAMRQQVLDEAAWQHRSDTCMRQQVADWRAVASGCSRSRGLVDGRDASFASVEDDGRAAQAATARRLQENLLLVDGRLHHRVPAPHYQVLDPSPAGVPILVNAPRWPVEGEDDPALGPTGFALSRLDDALAFARAWGASYASAHGVAVPGVGTPAGRVVDVGDPGQPFAVDATFWARLLSDAARPVAGFLDDAGLEAYARLRRAATAGFSDDAEACAGMEMARDVVDAVDAARERVVRLPNRGRREDDMSMYNDALNVGRMVLLRYDVVERPRLGLETEDEMAFQGIAP